MIKRIRINRYRKLHKIDINFENGINAISGVNGTCKTSLLHLISNSFQAPVKKEAWIKNKECLAIINKINSITNPKIESLTRGDKKYNDPANGTKGTLFSVEYVNGSSIDFRRHNSSISTRYAVKPKYKNGSSDKLPYCQVIYLGLSRLISYGEYSDDDKILKINKKLPESYQEEFVNLYNEFTSYKIKIESVKQIGDLKIRNDFTSNIEGIDSNTISAGEDNLGIILTALLSLRYYYESIESNNEIESILLIDELDATLHPAFQFKLLELFREYSKNYKIQIVFTTHSLSILENMLNRKDNVIYFMDNESSAFTMSDVDINKIKMYLYNKSRDDIYSYVKIPIFTEDDEARVLLDELFMFFCKNKEGFTEAYHFFHCIECRIGADNLKTIFNDDVLSYKILGSICILDGDKENDINKCIITLPGKKSPEVLAVDWLKKIICEDSDFWKSNETINEGYGKTYCREHILNEVEKFENEIQEIHQNGDSTKGKKREFYKQLFIDNKKLFKYIFRDWINNNKKEVDEFYDKLNLLFKKISQFVGINSKVWQNDKKNN